MDARDESRSAETPGLAAELRAACVTPRFWGTVALQIIPVVGVIRFGWSAGQIGMYFVLQSWLMLSIYFAADMTFNAKYLDGKAPLRGAAAVLRFCRVLLVSSLICAAAIVWLGMYFEFSLFDAFFSGGEYRQGSFLIGLGALVVGCVAEGVRYVLSLPRRTPQQIAADDARVGTLAGRVIVLFFLGVFLGIFQVFGDGWGNAALVLAIAGLQIYFDGMPQTAAASLQRRQN